MTFVAACLCLAGAGTVDAQPPGVVAPVGLPAPEAPKSFVQEHWTVQDGLPVDGITRVLQGRDGYIWLATWDGVVRFDGVRFTVFSSGNADGLPSNRIIDMIEGADTSLWLRTEQGHLVRMHDGRMTHVGAALGAEDRGVGRMFTGDSGHVWFTTARGLRRWTGIRFVRVLENIVRGEVTALLRERNGTTWVGTREDGLLRIRDTVVTRFDSASGLPSDWVTALRQHGDGAIWVGTARGVGHVRSDSLSDVALVSGRPMRQVVTSIELDPATRDVWLTTYEGIYVDRGHGLHAVAEAPGLVASGTVRVAPDGEVWASHGERLFRNDELIFRVPAGSDGRTPAAHIADFAWDHEGSIWVSTTGGLYNVKAAPFRAYSTAEGLPNRNVAVVMADRSGTVWIGTNWGGLARLQGERATAFQPGAEYPAFVQALMQDTQGDLWVGAPDRLLHCRLPAVACGAPPGGSLGPGSSVRALHQDATGDVWAGTERGLFRLHGGTWARMDSALSLGAAAVRAFATAPDGTLWMGTNGAGVLAWREERLSRLTAAGGLPGGLVRSLYVDARNQLWVGTEGLGLARVASGRAPAGGAPTPAIRAIRQRDGLYDEVIHAIVEDDAGRLWMSSNRGIFWVALAELDAFADGRVARIHSTVYTERDGMRNREANGGNHPAGVRAPDGRLWFATQDGVVVVDPADARQNQAPPRVVIERLVTHGREVRTSAGPIALPSGDRDFEIDYTALSFRAPQNMRFRYRLEGLTTEWTEAGARRTAFYTNVPPGNYTFRVVASNNDGVWNEVGASVALGVAPYFRETRTALAVAGLLALLAGVGGVRWRLGTLRRRERELTVLVETRTADLRQHEQRLAAQNAQLAELHEARSRLFANLSHEFRTPLTLIMGPLRSLLEGRQGALPAGARAQGELMLRNAQRLLRLINQILDLARLQAGAVRLDRRPLDLVVFVRAATLAFAPLAERRGITLRFHGKLAELPLEFDAEQLEKVLLNLVSNALKFTEAGGAVDVVVDADGEAAWIVVRDSGVGIAPNELPRVFERFYQADASATRRYEGTGIGLALARELVELHGGHIRAESVPGVGSTFTVRLPRAGPTSLVAADGRDLKARDDAVVRGSDAGSIDGVSAEIATPLVREDAAAKDTEQRDPGMLPMASQADADEDRTTVLIVDDNADVRAYVRSILEPSYRILEADDGRAGLEAAQTALPDLIVADVMMPELDGLALGRALKADAMTDAIPVVLLTARASPEDQVAGLGTGADAYLVKPFDPAVLEAQVANLLAQRRRLRERFRDGGAVLPGPESDVVEPSALEQRLRPLVEARLHDPGFAPETLAAAASLSYHRLYRALRDELETTPSRYIRTVRVECAAVLLRQGAGSVTEIAYSVGFESLSYFGRAYRERFGVSPREHLGNRESGIGNREWDTRRS